MKPVMVSLFTIILVASLFLSGCDREPSENFNGLISELQHTGFTVVIGNTERDTHVFFVSFRNVSVNGETIQVYEFDDTDTARQEADLVSNDGSSVTRPPGPKSTSDTTTVISIGWIAPPHFFQSGNMIVLYIGSNAAIIEALSGILGEQFAGD